VEAILANNDPSMVSMETCLYSPQANPELLGDIIIAMTSSDLARDPTVENQLEDSTREEHFNLQERNTNFSSDPTSSRTIVRRRRPTQQPQPSHIKAMSLVGLKNLFYGKTITPLPRATKISNSAWINASEEPLLRDGDRSVHNTTNSLKRASHESDLESQDSLSSKIEKASARGFRIDARVISDATIGLSDGLTVPFALTAGLSALGNTKFVIYGGFAELIAGAISMGVGGYLGAKSES
jgi:hypothetical protein